MIIAISLDPTYVLGWVGRAAEEFTQSTATSTPLTTQQRQDLMNRSFADLQQAVTINPDQALAHYQVGYQLGILGQTDKAQIELALAKKLAATDITLGAIEKIALMQRADATAQFLTQQTEPSH